MLASVASASLRLAYQSKMSPETALAIPYRITT
jgi:hypothetical protein